MTTDDIPYQVVDTFNIGLGLISIGTVYCIVDAGETDEIMNLSIGLKSAKLIKTIMDAGIILDKVKLSIGISSVRCYMS
jgi:hypothetical protein